MKNDFYLEKMNFPGHKYLGPGNDSNSGAPVDSDDAIAKKHDIDYDNAKTHKDVRKADREAIKNFTGDLVTNANWHSAVGAAGLASKYTVETVTGVVYPVVDKNDSDKGGCIIKKKVEDIKDAIEPVLDELNPLK